MMHPLLNNGPGLFKEDLEAHLDTNLVNDISGHDKIPRVGRSKMMLCNYGFTGKLNVSLAVAPPTAVSMWARVVTLGQLIECNLIEVFTSLYSLYRDLQDS